MIVAMQQFMYKEEKGKGKVSFTNKELADKIHMSERDIYRCNNELAAKGLIQTKNNRSLALDGTGLKSTTKIYDLKTMGQAIIWKLKDHEDRITELEQNMPTKEDIRLKDHEDRITKLEQNMTTKEDIRQLTSEIVKSEINKVIADKFREQDLKIQQQTEQLTNLTKAMYKLLELINLLRMKTEKQKSQNTQYVQVPTKLKDNTNIMNIREYYIYSWLKYFDGDKGCFPSQKVLSEKSHLGIKLIKSLITSLSNKGFISITKKGRSNYYEFTKYEKFQRYSILFMKNNILTPNEKMFLMYMQQYMYLDNTTHEGRISFTIDKMKEITNRKSTWIYKILQSLANKGLVIKLINKSRDIETGCHTITYIFDLDQIGQNLLFKQVTKNTEDIEKHTKNIEELYKAVKSLIDITKKQSQEIADLKKQNATNRREKMLENRVGSTITL